MDGAGRSVDAGDPARDAVADAEAAALADREAMDAAVLGQRRALGVDDPPGLSAAGRRLALDEAGVVTVGDEADLLALRLLGDRQAESTGMRAHLALGEVAERKARPGELGLGQAEEKVGLVLGARRARAAGASARRRSTMRA